MEIIEVYKNKKEYINLLLLADEQENMIDRYINRGRMFVLRDNGVKGVCIVTEEENNIIEIKNIAIKPEYQHKGYGRILINFIEKAFSNKYEFLQVGTGDSPLTIPFYEKYGFIKSHKIKNFFTDNYDHPIFECGIQLVDMIYLKKKIIQ